METAIDWSNRKLHFVGIGGAGMSGLARIAIELGATVSGSDRSSTAVLDELERMGAAVSVGHDPENLPLDCELVYSSAITPESPERAAAFERGLVQHHRSELLGEMTRLRRTIAISGTHGKTTTTAMVLSALRGAGGDPGWMVGANLPGGEASAGWGSDQWFVVEADESDRSLLNFSAEIAMVTNCELDHHATYESLDDLRETFRTFLAGAANAIVWDRPELLSLVAPGRNFVAYEAQDQSPGASGSVFTWRGLEVALQVPGAHNATNAAGALEAAFLAGADPAGAVAGVCAFTGTGRRFERVGTTASGALLIDDYAHHPTEVAATLQAARSVWEGRVTAVFQPHLYSRTEAFANDFGAALAAADRVVVLDIYPAREQSVDFPGVDSSLISAAAAKSLGGEAVSAPGGLDEAFDLLSGILEEDDLCLLMGAGDVGTLAGRLRR